MSRNKSISLVVVFMVFALSTGLFAQVAGDGAGPNSEQVYTNQLTSGYSCYWNGFSTAATGGMAVWIYATTPGTAPNFALTPIFQTNTGGIAYAATGSYTDNTGTFTALATNTIYACFIYSYNTGGAIVQSKTSPGQWTDNTPPVTGTAGNGTTTNYQSSATTISPTWSGFSDAQSGINIYMIGIGTTQYATNIVPLTTYSNSSSSAAFAVVQPLVNGTKYYATIEAFNSTLGAASVAGGGISSAILKNDGTVWGCGDNSVGEVGDNTTIQRNTLVQVGANNVYLNNVVAIAGGSNVGLAGYTVALKGDGTVWAWGLNTDGELGDTTTIQRNSPVQVATGAGTYINNVRAIAVSDNGLFTVALKNDGTVWTWGNNGNGQLGNGTTTNSSTPIQVSGLSGIIAIAAGNRDTLALKSDGTVWAWGGNTRGEVGDTTTIQRTTPVQVATGVGTYLSGIIDVAIGDFNSIGLKNDGTVWTWGSGIHGELGNGGTVNSSTPVQMTGISGAIGISGGVSLTVVLKSDGTVWACGYNNYGELGNNAAIPGADVTTATQVVGVGGVGKLTGITAISAGSFHALALKNDGTLWAWGRDLEGELGNNSTTNISSPVQMMGFGPAASMVVSPGVTVDTTAPVPGTVTNAGGGVVSGAFQSSTTYINGSWANWGDALSGMLVGANTYSVGVVNAAGAQIQAMTNYANTATSCSFTGLTLTSGTKYYVVMTGQDAVGNTTAIIYSNGVTVDTAPPTNGTVNNTNAAGATITLQNWTNNIYASWSGFSDALSGVANYSVGVLTGGTGAGSAYLVPLASYVNTATSATFTGLTLTNGTRYYIAMQATDNVGNISALVYSNGVQVDTDAPTGGTVTDAGGGTISGAFQSSATYINANWANWSDATAAVTQYQVGIQIWGGAAVVALTNYASTSTSASFTGLSLTSGTKYYVVFTAQDAAGNVTSVIYSNGITVDTAAPVAGTVTNAGGGVVSGAFQSSATYINGSWANWSDALSGMLTGTNTYSVGVVNAAGTQIVAMANYANTTTSCSFTGLALTSGTKYYVVMTGQDAVGNVTAIIYSNGVTVDTAPPTGTANNTNSAGATITAQNSTTTLYAGWLWSDALSGMLTGVNTYQVGILSGGTGAGSTYIVPLTNYANTATSAAFTGLSLTNGTKYYVAMNAQDAVGNVSALIYSNGVVVDTTPPVNGTVTNTGAGTVSGAFQSSGSTINGSWANFGDAIDGMLIGANTYQVGVINYSTGAYVQALTNYANAATSMSFTGLALTSGTRYYVQVTAFDAAGNATTAYSSTITVDATGPAAGTVTVNGGSAYQASTTTITCSWANFSDALSGMLVGANTYQVGVGTTPGATDVVALKNYANTATSATFTGLTLTSGTKYYVTVVAGDAVGNTTTVNSTSVTVDTAPPTGTVNNTNAAGATITTQSSTNALYVSWSFSDALSGMTTGASTYQVGLLTNTTPASATIAGGALTNYSNTAASATFTGLTLTPGTKYYAEVITSDAVGNATTVYSSGVTIVSGPTGGVANNTNSSGATITFQNSTNTLNANWSGWTDAAAAINTYQVGVVTNPLTGAYIVALQNYGSTLSSATFTGLTLTNGTKYYIQVTAVDALSNSTTVYSSGVTVDTSLVSGAVNNGLGANVSYQASTTAISANWSGFSDTISGISQYQVGVGTTPGATNVVALTNYANTATSATFTGLTLTVGTTYYVTITATSGGGFTTTANSSGITIASAPTITSFSGTPTSGIAPVSITFTSVITSSTSPLASVVYNFGDGSTLSATSAGSVSHTYTTAGTYYANVTATNGVSSATSTTAVVITAPPTAPGGLTITASTANGTTIGTAPFPVTFTFGSTSTDISRYSLSFGDAGVGVYQYVSSTAGSTTYSYTLAGSYTVYLNAVNTSGIGSTITYANAIVVSAPTAPTFSVAPAASPAGPYNVGQTVTFTATGAAGAGATGASIYYQWSFGSSGVVDVSTPAHTGADTETFTYTSPGTYTVTCIISDSNGGGPRMSAKATISVSVAAPSPSNIRVWLVQPYSNGINFYKPATGSGSITISASAAPYNNINFSTLNFQYSANGGASWLNAAINSLASAGGTAVFIWDTTLVTSGTYLVRVQVTDINGFVHSSNDAGQQGAISVNLVNALTSANVAQYTVTGGTEEFTTISNSTGVSAITEGSGISCNVTLPANATTLTGAGKVYLDTLSSNPAPAGSTTGVASGNTLTGFSDIHITDATGGTGTALITKPIGVVIGYTSTDGVTIDGTTISVSSLQLMHYNSAKATWETLPGQVIDTTHKTITSTASSLSPFALAGLAIASAAGGGAGGGLGLGGLAAVALCGTTGFDALLALGLVLLLNRYLRKRKIYKQS